MKNPLQKQFDQLEHYFEKGNIVSSATSQKGIYWHVDHCLRILEGVPDAMRQSKPADYKAKSSLMKSIIMTTGWIPRGKGKSPKQVLPDENVLDAATVKKRFDRAFHEVNNAATLPDTSFFKHPLFGCLKRDEALKFLKIHTNHHLKIMRDIVR